jgi:hypothetical protein
MVSSWRLSFFSSKKICSQPIKGFERRVATFYELPGNLLSKNDPPVLAKTDPSKPVTMDGHARCPEETMPDLPPVVPAG